MRRTGCTPDPLSNSYCFVNAVHNQNPSDLYFYQLPLGTQLPKGTTPTCSACTKNLLSLYSAALTPPDSATAQQLTGLRKAYGSAAKTAVAECGTAYATLSASNSAGPTLRMVPAATLLVAAAFALAVNLV